MHVCDATKLGVWISLQDRLSVGKKENSGEIFQKRLVSEDEHRVGPGLFLLIELLSGGRQASFPSYIFSGK
jgi:hypothetical protein